MTTAAQAIPLGSAFTLGQPLNTADFLRPGAIVTFDTPPTWREGKVDQLPAGTAPPPLTDPGFVLTAGYIHATASPADPAYVPAGYPFPAFSWLSDELAVYPNGDAIAASGYNPFSVAGGVLTITADHTPAKVLPWLPAGFSQAFVSGAFCSYPYSQTYGYFEIKMEIPGPLGAKSVGYWPAFWLMPVDMSWPPELDVIEIWGGMTAIINSTVHSTAYKGVLPDNSTLLTFATNAGLDLSEGYHLFGVDWGPAYIAVYLDRTLIFVTPTPADLHKPLYWIVDFAIGGPKSMGGAPTADTVFPAKLRIASVGVWQREAYLPGT